MRPRTFFAKQMMHYLAAVRIPRPDLPGMTQLAIPAGSPPVRSGLSG